MLHLRSYNYHVYHSLLFLILGRKVRNLNLILIHYQINELLQIKKHIRTGKISAINAKGLGKAIIPIPTPEEQERIVNILDNFDMLTTSLSEALPKEIELRKKQYEYYRNMLLTFPKDAVEV